MNRPIILTVLAGYGSEKAPVFGLRQSYFRALYDSGANVFSVGRPEPRNLVRMLFLADGVLLAGGDDINPWQYHERNHFARMLDRERDRIELALAKMALARRVPLLGICRGMQVMNVATGGSLHQDLSIERPGVIRHDRHFDEYGAPLPRSQRSHGVQIQEGTLLRDIAGARTINVNSLHHQGIKRVGRGLVASAHAPDGLVEAVEYPKHPFALGVEWHPEELRDSASKRLFKKFISVAAAKNRH